MSAGGVGGGSESRTTTLLVDHDSARAEASRMVLERAGYRVITASDAAAGLRLLSAHDCDIVICDLELPDMDGLEVCRAIKQAPATRQVPVVLVAEAADELPRQRAQQAGAADFLSRPLAAATLLAVVRAQILIAAQQRQITDLEGLVLTLARAVEDRDHLSGGLAEKVAHWALQLGRSSGLDDEALNALYRAALLHDVGTLAIPVTVLSKAGRLDPDEYGEVKRHPVVGEQLLRALPDSAPLLAAVRHHHERVDGAGYPDGLSSQGIPLFARIIAVADAYVAITSDRPYRRRRSREEATAILRQGAGKQWDADLVERFVAIVDEASAEARIKSAG